MKIRFFLLVAAASALIGPLVAGTLEMQPKETAPPTVTESEPWQFTIAVPGWLSSMDGTIGVRGVNADIDVPVTEVLQHFDAILAGRVEAQKGPFGIFGEVIYIGLSDGAQINGLINNIHETVDTNYVYGALSWRLVIQPRWLRYRQCGSRFYRSERNSSADTHRRASSTRRRSSGSGDSNC